MIKKVLYSILIPLVLSSIAIGQEPEIFYLDEPYISAVPLVSDENPPTPIALLNITDTLSDNVVGHEAVHQVGFQLPYFDSTPVGLLRGRQVVVTFTPDFDVRTVYNVTYFDTDDDSDDPEIKEILIYNNSVVVRFKDRVPGPETPHFAYLRIHTINNPVVADDYQVVVMVDNLLRQTIAGPGFSEPFEVIPDEAYTLSITPDQDMTLTAGEGVSFEAAAADQYGNPIESEKIEWSLDEELDPIGDIFDAFLLATTTGYGRVVAKVDNLEARSGLISTIPGEFAALGIDLDETQFVGNPFRGTARVRAFDKYGNIVTGFANTGTVLNISSLDGTITPETIPADAFVDGIAELNGYVYDGIPGIANLSVSNGADIEITAEFMANGLYLVEDMNRLIPDWILTEWEFTAYARILNPAGLTPSSVAATGGFVESDAPDPLIDISKDCTLLPDNGGECHLKVAQKAVMTPGTYRYDVVLTADYEFEAKNYTARWVQSREIVVDPFVPFTYSPEELPEVAFAGDYTIQSRLNLFNENSYDRYIYLGPGLLIRSGNNEYIIGSSNVDFDWESSLTFEMETRFSPELPEGNYNYFIKTKAVHYPEDRSWRISYSDEYPLDAQLEIAPRAQLSVDTSSISPKIVAAGQPVSFAFDLDLNGTTEVVLDGTRSRLSLTDGITSTTAYLALDQYTIVPGSNPLATEEILIPDSWEGKTLTGTLYLAGNEAGLFPIEVMVNISLPVTVGPSAAVKLTSVHNMALNTPFVNTGQEFTIIGGINNISESDLPGPFTLELSTNGQSILPPPVVIDLIPATDTPLVVSFTVTAASEPNTAEVFTLNITDAPDNVEVLPATENFAIAVVQTPAEIEIFAAIVGHPESVANLGYGENFQVKSGYHNLGQSNIDGGTVILSYDGPGDFGLAFPDELELDTAVYWSLTAPAADIASGFTTALGEIPTDRNTGQPATVTVSSAQVNFEIIRSETKLIMEAGGFSTRPLERGVASKLFDLSMQNYTTDNRNVVGLKSLAMEMVDRDGNIIDARDIIDVSHQDGTNFYLNEQPIGEIVTGTAELSYTFPSLTIQPGQVINLEFKLKPSAEAELDYFNIRLTGENIAAEIIDGPQAGQDVPAAGLLDRAFEINIPQAIVAEEFAASFKNYPNPFNPVMAPTEIRYNLPADSDVDIYIYTATGEEVRHMHFDAGSNGGQQGLNAEIFWDGRNGNGDMVLNGVYVAYIEVAASGLTATVKLAVVK